MLPESACMAAQRLCGLIYLFLLTSFLVGASKAPCEKHLRSRKPLLESLQWETYWVPLMIILGGCCAMAWSILFIAYDVARPRGYGLPQIPGTLEERQKEGGPMQASPKETKETKEDTNLLESKNSKELLGTSLETKGSREEIELDRTGSREDVGNAQQSKESKGAKEGIENLLEIKSSREGIENQVERRGSQEGSNSPFLQRENDLAPLRPDQVEGQPCGKLWTTMEKELERLLKLLRFCRSSGPGLLAEGSLGLAIEEAMPPPATETPKPAEEETLLPTQPQELPTIPATETLRPPSSGQNPAMIQNPATVHLIICGLPCSTCPNTGQRRPGGSRGRK